VKIASILVISVLAAGLIGISNFDSVFAEKNPNELGVVLIYSTPNGSCDQQEMNEFEIYKQSIKQYLNKFNSNKQLTLSTFCTHVDEIKTSTYPLLLQSLNVQRPEILIVLGDTEINEDLVIFEHALGVWGCLSQGPDYQCKTNVILGCTDCQYRDEPVDIETGVWTITHELSHYLAFQQLPTEITEASVERFQYVSEGVHTLQTIYNYCAAYNYFEPCNGMSFNLNVNGKLIPAMNFDYILNNAKDLPYFDTSVFVAPESITTTESSDTVSESIVTSTEFTLPSELLELGLFADGDYVGNYIAREEGESVQFVGNLINERDEPVKNSIVNIVNKQTGVLQKSGVTDGVGNFIMNWKTKANLDNLVDGQSELEFVATGKIDSKTVTSESVWISITASEHPVEIPKWIKNNAAWWSSGIIGDSEFSSGIEFMIKEKLVQIDVIGSEKPSSVVEIPNWVKLNAEWWSSGQLTDDEFTKSIEYLVKEGIIKV